jgi:hypothetical protein
MCEVSTVGRAILWIVCLQVCVLAFAYKSIQSVEYVPTSTVFGLFTAIEVFNSTFYLVFYLALEKIASLSEASDEAAVGSLKEALLVAA